MVGANRAVARHDDRTLDDRQQIALDTLSGDIRAVITTAVDRLVDLVDKDDAGFLDALDCRLDDRLHINQPRRFLLGEDTTGFADRDAALLAARAKRVDQFTDAVLQLLG